MLTIRRGPRSSVALPAALGGIESTTALVLAHLAAGGDVPRPALLLVFASLTFLAGRPTLRGRADIRVVLPLLIAAQVLGHAWLLALAPGVHAGHVHPGPALLGLTPSMLVAHGIAGLLTGCMWALRRRAGELIVGCLELRSGTAPSLARPTVLPRRPAPVRGAPLTTAPTRGPPPARTPAAA